MINVPGVFSSGKYYIHATATAHKILIGSLATDNDCIILTLPKRYALTNGNRVLFSFEYTYMSGSRKFCQRGPNFDNVFFSFLFLVDERREYPKTT